jgi:hypothetical protein
VLSGHRPKKAADVLIRGVLVLTRGIIIPPLLLLLFSFRQRPGWLHWRHTKSARVADGA